MCMKEPSTNSPDTETMLYFSICLNSGTWTWARDLLRVCFAFSANE